MPMQNIKNVPKQTRIQPSDNKPSEELCGLVERILYQDISTGFALFHLAEERKKPIVVRGTFSALFRGQQIHVSGCWESHPRFGPQFKAETYYTTAPTSQEGLVLYLSSGLIKGIGEAFAKKIVDQFGDNVLTIIDQTPDRLMAIPGLGEKRLHAIMSSWQEHKELAQVMMLLREKGISSFYATKLYRQYRERTMAILRTNTYQIIDDIWGIGFTIADTIAQSMGLSLTDPLRITAGIRWELKKNAQHGHLYVPTTQIVSQTNELLGFSQEEEAQNRTYTHIQHLCNTQELIHVTAYQHDYIALPSAYHAEKVVAERLMLIHKTASSREMCCSSTATTTVPRFWNNLTAEQQAAVTQAVQQKITIITGGPGTGKTTLIRAIIGLLESQNISYKLAAPTGRAAKRMSESTKRNATTIHRLLEIDPSLEQFTYNEHHPLTADYIIIDESSMIDIFLAQALVKAIHPQSYVLFIGDIDQLPPVGPGNFLRDCIASATIPIVRLTHIFRQAHDSLITHNAHRIKSGEFPIARAAETMSDFIFIPEEDPEKFSLHVKRSIYIEAAQRGCTAPDITVLCPMNRGNTGTQQVNLFLQSCFNPTKQPSLMVNGTPIKMGDRVMQLRNAYDKFIFNGDIGIISGIDTEEGSCTVLFDGKTVTYTRDEVQELTLAYAMTIHKSQGSEFPVVIIPLFMQHYTMLRKNLVYTAVTRARTLCVLIGQKRALACALRSKTSDAERITLLTQLLQTAHSCAS